MQIVGRIKRLTDKNNQRSCFVGMALSIDSHYFSEATIQKNTFLIKLSLSNFIIESVEK